MAVKVLINPVVSKKEQFNLSHIIEILERQGWRAEIITLKELVQENRTPSRLPKSASNNHSAGEREKLIVIGGDGTLHQVLNTVGLQGLSRYELMVIPAGTANDLARSLGIPLNPTKACELLSRFGKPMQIDLGVINDRVLFSCAFSLGFGVEVTKFATRPIRNFFGKAALGWGAFRYMMKLEKPIHRMKLHYHQRKRSIAMQHLVVGNAKYHGGGYPIAPRADLQSGYLDLYRVKPLGFMDYVQLLGRMLLGQDHTEYRKKVRSAHLRELAIEIMTPLEADIDGELYQFPKGKIRLKSLPGQLTVITPDWEAFRKATLANRKRIQQNALLRRQGMGRPGVAS